MSSNLTINALRREIARLKNDLEILKPELIIHDYPKIPMIERVRRITSDVARLHGFEAAELRRSGRWRKLVYARQEAVWLVAAVTGWSTGKIGRWFGDIDHTTVIYSIRTFAQRNPEFCATWLVEHDVTVANG